MREVLQFLKDNKTFFFATMDEDQPRVRPFGAVTEFEGRLYFQTGKRKDVYQQMKANPRVEISAVAADGSRWIRIQGSVVEDARREARTAVLDDNPELRNLYHEDDGNCVVFYLDDAIATFFSFTHPKYHVVF